MAGRRPTQARPARLGVGDRRLLAVQRFDFPPNDLQTALRFHLSQQLVHRRLTKADTSVISTVRTPPSLMSGSVARSSSTSCSIEKLGCGFFITPLSRSSGIDL